MQRNGTGDGIPPKTVVIDGIRFERHLTVTGRGIIGTHRISTEQDDRVRLDIADPLPSEWPVDTADFHPDFTPHGGSITASAVNYRVAVDPDTPATLKFGLILQESHPVEAIRRTHADCHPIIEPTDGRPTASGTPPIELPDFPPPDRQPPRPDVQPTGGQGSSRAADQNAPPDSLGSPEFEPKDAPVMARGPADTDNGPTTATVYAVASAKGGVGKTTTSLNLGAALARVTAGRVIVVECDLAMSNFFDFVKLPVTPGDATTLHDVLAGSAAVDDAVYLAPGDFDVLPSGTTIDGYRGTDPQALPKVIETLRSRYDIVLIDCGAGVSYETCLPLGVADEVILVSQPRVASVRDTKKTEELAKQVGGQVRGVVFTNTGTGRAPPVDRIVDYIDTELLGHVPTDTAVPESQDIGLPVSTYHESSPASRAYRSIAETILDGPLTYPNKASDCESADGTYSAFSPDQD